MKNDTLKGQHRINEQIRAKEVRIVGDDIESAVYPIAQALKLAEEHEADLVEISPNAVPPVCRIIDYSKFLYQLKKRAKEQKAKQVKVNVKEIRFGPQTDEHDYNFKLKYRGRQGSDDKQRIGYRAGIGAQYDFNDNISARLMYRYTQLGMKEVKNLNEVVAGLRYSF